MTQSVISQARPTAPYQQQFAKGPIAGWAIQIDGEFRGIASTQPEAVDKARGLVSADSTPKITIDCR